jgi:ferric-dicitrate binding protein FerR (iron transport regulator)
MAYIDSSPEWDRISAYLFDQLTPAERRVFEDVVARSSELHACVAVRRRGLDVLKRPFEVEGQLEGRQRLMGLVLSQQPIVGRSRSTAVIEQRGDSFPGSGGLGRRTLRVGSMPRLGPRSLPFGTRTMLGGVTALAGTALLLLSRFDVDGAGPRAHHAPSSRMYATAIGQRATLRLDDGSRVTLAPQSRLVVALGANARELTLEGEAYFDVGALAHAPFVVRTGSVTTRVLGTAFTVRRYLGDHETQIAVINGRILAKNGNAHVIVDAGSIGTITDSTATTASIPDVQRYTEWTRGRIVFHQMPVPTLLATLGRWYGVQFRLADSAVVHRRVTGDFRSDELAETLAGLKDILDVTLTFDGQIVTLRGRAARKTSREEFNTSSHLTGVGK